MIIYLDLLELNLPIELQNDPFKNFDPDLCVFDHFQTDFLEDNNDDNTEQFLNKGKIII